jgi:hypothetical protein
LKAVHKGKVDLKEISSYNTNIEIVSEEKKPATPAPPPEPEVAEEAPAEAEVPAEE